MPINGTQFMTDPIGETFRPFTDFFQSAMGIGGFFFIWVIIILAIGLYIKTQDLIYTMLFIATSFGLLTAGSYMGGLPELSMLFAVFTGIGIAGLAINLILHIKR